MAPTLRAVASLLASGAALAQAGDAAGAAAVPPMREALLNEAKHRLGDWFLNKDWIQHPPPNGRLDWPKEEFGIQLQITTSNYICDAESKIYPVEGVATDADDPSSKPESIPITFGRFDVEHVEPIDVFNALADTEAQEHWDELLMDGPGVTLLGDFANEFARGAAASFVAHPFPDRQVFQWQVYNSTKAFDDMWVAFSTRRTEELHKRGLEREAWPAVQAQNCLGAYHVVKLPQGGCHVVFTTMVNSHPPWPITAQFVFNLLWTKTVGYIQALRDRAQYLYKQRMAVNGPPKPVIPDWLLYDGVKPNKTASGKLFVEGNKKTIPPFMGSDYIVDVIQVWDLKDLKALAKPSSHLPAVLLFACMALVVGSFAAYKRLRRGASAAQAVPAGELEEGVTPPLLAGEVSAVE